MLSQADGNKNEEYWNFFPKGDEIEKLIED